MKHTKRLLAVLLTLALALALALPAMAAVNWNEFRIISHPQDITIRHGESFTLSVEVNVPEGVEVEFQWYRSSSTPIEGATSSELHLSPSDQFYPEVSALGGSTATYMIRITAHEKDDDGNIISSRTLASRHVTVTTERTFWGRLYGVTLEPFVLAFVATFVQIVWTFGLLIPLSPLIYLGWLIYGFGLGFAELFR